MPSTWAQVVERVYLFVLTFQLRAASAFIWAGGFANWPSLKDVWGVGSCFAHFSVATSEVFTSGLIIDGLSTCVNELALYS